MTSYIARRLLWMLVTMFLVSLVTFAVIFAGPVDPARALVGGRSQAATIEAVRSMYGLDDPVPVQYLRYMRGLLRGDLGRSFYFHRPVFAALIEKVPATAQLALFTVLVIIVIGVPAGCICAAMANSLVDRAVMILGLVAISLPTFFIGVLLMYAFGFRLRWLPTGGYGEVRHFVLPALSVGVPWSAWYATMLRSNMLDAISADYVRTANAKGLRRLVVIVRHVLPNAILPVLTMLGMDTAALLTGIALVEYVFSWPGIGWQTVQAAQNYDVPLIMGSVLLGALLMQLANLVVDIAYGWLDPRVRLG